MAFFIGAVTLPKAATTVELGDLPTPAHGTLWVQYDEQLPLRGIFSSLEKHSGGRPASSISELLASNIGRTVRLEPGGVVGELISAEASLAVIRTATGMVAVSGRQLEEISIEGDDINLEAGSEMDRSVFRIELEEPAPGERVTISWLARGMTWAPSYLVDISDPGKAHFSAKAVVINEALDLDDVTLELVTGFPHLLFSEVDSPLAPSQTLQAFMRALGGGRGTSHSSSSILTQRVLSNQMQPENLALSPSYSTKVDQRSSGDLFFYPLPQISLRQNERAALPLLTAEMPYEHVYTWSIPDFIDAGQHRYDTAASKRTEEVWHVCRLTNATDIPLTTAPAQFIDTGRIVGQDLVDYTLPGAETDIRINRALDLLANQAEIEIARQPHKERIHGSHYDRVSIRGELRLVNRLGKAAQVEVSKSLSGEIGDLSGDPEHTRTTRGLREINPSHRLRWKLRIEAGETQSIQYDYTVLVRR